MAGARARSLAGAVVSGREARLTRRVADAHRAAGHAALRRATTTSTSAATVWNRLPLAGLGSPSDVERHRATVAVLARALRRADAMLDAPPAQQAGHAIRRCCFVAANAAFRDERAADRRPQGRRRAARRRDAGLRRRAAASDPDHADAAFNYEFVVADARHARQGAREGRAQPARRRRQPS